jgi:hypothetical protein
VYNTAFRDAFDTGLGRCMVSVCQLAKNPDSTGVGLKIVEVRLYYFRVTWRD